MNSAKKGTFYSAAPENDQVLKNSCQRRYPEYLLKECKESTKNRCRYCEMTIPDDYPGMVITILGEPWHFEC